MVLQRFADYAAGVREEAVPPEAVHAAKRCVIDWFASVIPGGAQPPATLLREAFADDLGHGRAVLYPSGTRAAARSAALINGAAAHTIEFDDIYRDAIYHPGAPVISAALPVAQVRGVGGDVFLRGVIAGYEVSNRLGVAVNPAHYTYWHTTGTIGAFGAAAAASSVLGLDAGRTVHALANAGTLAAGLQQAFRADAMAKPLHAGQAAETGVMVALAAEKGVTGAPDILDGERGFGAAMAGNPDWQAAADDLGRSYTITRTTMKAHAACGHAHAAIDGILALRREHALAPESVATIRVGTYAKALEITGNKAPRTAFEAKFSLPYCVAVALLTGRVRLDAFSKERLADGRLKDLMDKVELRVEPDMEAAFPGHRAATVEIGTVDGRRFTHHAPTRKGDPDNPLSDGELEDKFRELTAPVIGEAAAARLLETLWRIDAFDDMAELPVGGPDPVPGAQS